MRFFKCHLIVNMYVIRMPECPASPANCRINKRIVAVGSQVSESAIENATRSHA